MSNDVQNMQIFTIIGQLEELVEKSPRPKIGGSANKRIVSADEIMDLLGDLKVTIPEDIRRANSVIIESQTMIDNAEEHAKEVVAKAQQDSETMIAKAQATAQSINEKAQAEYERLISEDEIYQEAQRRAKLLAMKAEANAGMVFNSAKKYADDVLRDLENFLDEYKQLVAINRKDLDVRTDKEPQTAQPVQAASQPQPQPQSQQRPASAPAQKPRAQAPAAPVPENELDYDYDDDEEDSGSIFSKLFGRKKKTEDMHFDDEQ
jgi:cell division septum initiation protein DivIVA